MLRCNFPNRLKLNKDATVERQKYRATLTPIQQLKRLDDRLGPGIGAKKERARLNEQVVQEIAVQLEPKNKNRNKKNNKN